MTITLNALANAEEHNQHHISPAEEDDESQGPSLFDNLPDAVVLRIFSHLDAQQLLGAVRATCQRWRELALRREAWQSGTEVAVQRPRDVPLAFRAMRLAPCLRRLTLRVSTLPTYLLELACTTATAVHHLELSLAGPPQLATAVRIIRNQQARRHLRSMRISFVTLDAPGLEKILEVIADVEDLEDLDIALQQLGERRKEEPAVRLTGTPRAAPHRLKLCGTGVTHGVVVTLLSTWAACLRSVALPCPLRGPLAAALKKCVALEELSLRASWALRTEGEDEDVLREREEVVEFFRTPEARRLKSLSLSYDFRDLDLGEASPPCDDFVLLEVLESLKVGALERLHLCGVPLGWSGYAVRLSAALDGLPRLTTLRVDAMPDKMLLLDALAAREAEVPHLRQLEIKGCPPGGWEEVTPSLRVLVRARPWLHVVGVLPDMGTLGVHGHNPAQQCSDCRRQRDVLRWIWLGEETAAPSATSSTAPSTTPSTTPSTAPSTIPQAELPDPPTNDPWGQKAVEAEAGNGHKAVEKPHNKQSSSFWCCCGD